MFYKKGRGGFVELMATGSDQGASPRAGLGVSDLGVLCEVLHPVRSKYKHLGLQIGVDISTIQNIEADHSKAEDRLLEVFLARLNDHRALTWGDIVKALRSQSVASHQLANSIQTSYGIRCGPTIVDQPRQTTHQKSESMRKTRKITSPLRHKTEQEQELGKEVRENLESKMSRKHTRKMDIDDKPISINNNEEEIDRRENKGTKSYIQSESEFNSAHHQKVSGNKHKHISRQRIQKYVQIESQSELESNAVNSDSSEESYSSEKEEDSAEEVSETERYQKPSEQPRKDEHPHSHRETPVRMTKGKRGESLAIEKSESQTKPEEKAKRKEKAVDQSTSNKVSQHKTADAHGECKRVARKRKQQKKSEKHSKKGVQKVQRESESESSTIRREEERVSASYHRGKSRKPKSEKNTHQQKQTQGNKLEYQRKMTAKKDVEKKVKVNNPLANEQSSDEEVREKPTTESLQMQTRSDSENESSFANTSDDESELHVVDISTAMKEHYKVHPKSDENDIEKERVVRTKKKAKVIKQRSFHNFDTEDQIKEGKRSTNVDHKSKKTSKEKYLKADTNPRKQRKKQAETSKKIVSKQGTPSSDSTQEDSEDEESDSDDSSEDKEDRDSEQKSSKEEEETEPDDESSSDTSEEEVKIKPDAPYTKKDTWEIKGKVVMIAADSPGDEDQSDPGGRDQEEHDIQQKKRSRRRHRESSMSPTARGSSSPSTSQEETQRQVGSRKRKGEKRNCHKHSSFKTFRQSSHHRRY